MTSRHLRISCPHCQRSGLRIRPELVGQKVVCKHCGKTFRSDPNYIPTSPQGPSGPTQGAEEVAGGNAAGDRPRPSRAESDASRTRLELEVSRLSAAARESRAEADRARADTEAARREADRVQADLEATRAAAGRW